MNKFVFIIPLVLAVFVLAGCGGKPAVRGKVQFADGAPLKHGTVLFESGNSSARGQIAEDGSYALESTGTKDGVKPGDYRVSILGAVESYEVDSSVKEGSSSGKSIVYKNLIDPKFQSAATSGLTCKVAGNTTYDISVTSPSTP